MSRTFDEKTQNTKEFFCPYTSNHGINRGRVVLHADLNNFFASVECANSPDRSIFSKPVAVCGNIEMRHGIILAKNEKAKLYGVKTGEKISDAKKKCPSLILMGAHYDLYMRYSRAARKIYQRYTDRVEPFGMDEAWLELTGNDGICTVEDGKRVADEIRKVLKEELGITASVGVSDNKIFAKLGSDYKKPDATTVLARDQYQNIISPMPASEILYVGRSTAARLRSYGITTIGDVARQNPHFLKSILGKNGEALYTYCRGEDTSPVALFGEVPAAKSMGNSTTPPKDISSFSDAKLILSSLCDTVCSRLRAENTKCRGIKMNFRDINLCSFERQIKLDFATSSARDLLAFSCRLLAESVDLEKTPLRSMGICAIDLVPADIPQISLFEKDGGKKDVIDSTVDKLRLRFGFSCVSTALTLCDREKLGYIARGYEVFTNLR
ncbi:MAG: DNA polymerase IV [Clostridia bacterium]|nr:DNA polymerase IV [Clostridia bacterium]